MDRGFVDAADLAAVALDSKRGSPIGQDDWAVAFLAGLILGRAGPEPYSVEQVYTAVDQADAAWRRG